MFSLVYLFFSIHTEIDLSWLFLGIENDSEYYFDFSVTVIMCNFKSHPSSQALEIGLNN